MNFKKFIAVLLGTGAFLIPAVAFMQTNMCTSLTLTLNDGKTTYNVGESVNYTWTCTSGPASYVGIWLQKPDGTSVLYNYGSGSATQTMGFGTSNLVAGIHILKACLDTSCSSVAASQTFTIASTASSIPNPPSSASATSGTGYVYVSWPSSANATHYSMDRSVNGGAYGYLNSGFSNTYYNDTAITSGSVYRYKVYACKSGYGCSTTGTESNSVSYTVTTTSASTSTSSTSGWLSHTWTFSNGTTVTSYILNRTDSEYLTYISSIDSLCRLVSSSQYTWKPNAGDSSGGNWQNFGIPECSATSNTTTTTTTTTTSSGSSGSSSGSATTVAIDTIPPSVNNFGYSMQTGGYFRAGVSFSEAIDKNSVSASSVYIAEASTGVQVPGVATAYYSGADFLMSAVPKANTDYVLVVRNIKDVYGNQMSSTYTSSLFRNTVAMTSTTNIATTTASSTTPAYSTTTTTTSSSSTTIATDNTVAPVISGAQAGNIIGQGAQIKWNTNIPANSGVFYGPSLSYGLFSNLRCDGTGYVAIHCVYLTGLVPNTRYYYKVFSAGQNNLSSEFGGLQFISGTMPASTATNTTATMPVTTFSTTTTGTVATTAPKTSDDSTEAVVSNLKGILSISAMDNNGSPVASAPINVWLSGGVLNYHGVTDEKGLFKAEVSVGDYYLDINQPEGRNDLIKPAPAKISVSANGTVSRAFIFNRNIKKITGTVQYSDGTPVAFVNVGAYSEEGHGWVSAQTDKNGSFELMISGGKWRIGAYPSSASGAVWQTQTTSQEVILANDTSGETRNIKITIPATNSTVVVSASISGGGPIPAVGITVDSVRGTENETGRNRIVVTKQAGADGTATFILPPGKYYVRGFGPNTLYFNPEEKEFTVSAGATSNISIVFNTKQTLAETVTMSGTAVTEDKAPADNAMIGAWSEKGGYRDTRTNPGGKWSLVVPPGDKWHIRAVKEKDRYPYYSTEVVIEATGTPSGIELVITKTEEKRLPKTVDVSRPVEEESVVKMTDGAKVTVPANPVSNIVGGTVNVEVKPTAEAPSQAGAQVLSTVYDVSMKDSYGTSIKAFDKDIEIELPYDPEELKKQGVTEDTIKPSYFDEVRKMWVTIDNFTLDRTRHVIVARVKHLTRFAIVSAADVTPPEAPAGVSVVSNTGGLAIAWNNPASDFDHSKVYRSEDKSTLGTVIAAEVSGTNYTDGTTSKGVKYYYTVRAVDPAGNESTNTNQVFGIGMGTAASLPKTAPVAGSFSRNLKYADRGSDVILLQTILAKEGFLDAEPTGFFGSKTMRAVIQFQEANANELLIPYGLSKGTGVAGRLTRQKLTSLNTNR